MNLQFILYEKAGPIAVVKINRPEVMNALHYPANAELYDVWTDFAEDPELRVAVLTGVGEKAFCADADLKHVATLSEAMPNRERIAPHSRVQMGGLVHREIWKPIIAAVNGYCLGGGLEIAMACDIVIAAENAQFGQPEIKRGWHPGSGGTHRLPRHVPLKIAMQMLLTGDHITAEEALRAGLVNKVVPLPHLMPESMTMARKVADNHPVAVQAVKEMVAKSLDLPLEYPDDQGLCAWDLEETIGAMVRASADWESKEGARAFVEKRRPVWKVS